MVTIKKRILIGETNMDKCKELLDRLTTTPIRVRVQDKIYTMYKIMILAHLDLKSR